MLWETQARERGWAPIVEGKRSHMVLFLPCGVRRNDRRRYPSVLFVIGTSAFGFEAMITQSCQYECPNLQLLRQTLHLTVEI